MKTLILLFVVPALLGFASQADNKVRKLGVVEVSKIYRRIKVRRPGARSSGLPKYRIAVIDTGFDPGATGTQVKICPSGSHDYTTGKDEVGSAEEKHGTMVSSIIAEPLEDIDYCIYVFQVYGGPGRMFEGNVNDAINRARKLGAVAANLSFRSGFYARGELDAIAAAVKSGMAVFVAAGNEARDLNVQCDVYPACYKIEGMQVVGALTADEDIKASYSNYGQKVTLWNSGIYQDPMVQARGTSFATPRALAEYILFLASQDATQGK